MAKPRKAPLWRGRFLRALRRTGNVTAAAEMAGVDKSSVYLRRKSDRGFARRWDAALAASKARNALRLTPAKAERPRPLHHAAHGPPPRSGADMVLRNSKRGAQMVRAGEGRWSQKIEEAFLDHYSRSGCIRWAAKAAGVSARTIHTRRKNYPGFAAKMAACAALADERLRELVRSAGLATFDPELRVQAEAEGVPRASLAEAIAILRLKGPSGKAEEPVKLPPIEEVRASILRKLDAIEAHEKANH